MSRYWIWKEAPRTRVGRQVVLYWMTSIACIAGTSLATGAVANLVPPGHPFHLVVVGAGFLVVSVLFWVAKFVIYQVVIFPVAKTEAGESVVPAPDPTGVTASGGVPSAGVPSAPGASGPTAEASPGVLTSEGSVA